MALYDLETRLTYEPEWQQEHLAAWIFGIFAWLALALAAVGLHSVVSYTVAQRTNEFGIRMALGAQRGDLLRMVFRSALVSLGAGIVAGVALSLALNQIIAKWAQGNPRDPVILSGRNDSSGLRVWVGMRNTGASRLQSRSDDCTT